MMEMVPNGVVLDQPLAEALLFAAVQERMVDNEPSIGDGFVARLLKSCPSQGLIDLAFEQLVLGGTAIMPFWLPPDWRGELFDSNTVCATFPVSENTAVEVSNLPSDVVLGMLSARGVFWDESTLLQLYERYMNSYKKWEIVADGKSFDGIEIRKVIRAISKDNFDDYTPEQLAAWDELSLEYRNLRPVMECIDAYSRIVGTSLSTGALSSVPVVPSAITIAEPRALPTGSETLQLFRITCKELRRVPVARTLKETLKIARSDEAGALRRRLAKWTFSARQQDINAVEVALTDIGRARKALLGANRAARVGEYATWIGLPVSIAGAFLAGPIGTAVGITISSAGVIAVGTQKLIERTNKWAMFAAE